MNILGPLPMGAYQNKYLIVAMEYFTKWIKAEALTKITTYNTLYFYKQNMLTQFGVYQALVTKNGTQFKDRKFKIS